MPGKNFRRRGRSPGSEEGAEGNEEDGVTEVDNKGRALTDLELQEKIAGARSAQRARAQKLREVGAVREKPVEPAEPTEKWGLQEYSGAGSAKARSAAAAAGLPVTEHEDKMLEYIAK
eukprot:RCo011059